jgi:hypothetical protein
MFYFDKFKIKELMDTKRQIDTKWNQPIEVRSYFLFCFDTDPVSIVLFIEGFVSTNAESSSKSFSLLNGIFFLPLSH